MRSRHAVADTASDDQARVPAPLVRKPTGGRGVLTQVKRKWLVYLMILPTVLGLLIFSYYPPVSAFYHAFFSWDGVNERFVGLRHFQDFLQNRYLMGSVVNLVKLLIWSVLLNVTAPLWTAELLFHLKSKSAQYWYRVLFILPVVVPGVVVVLLWKFIYGIQGPINLFLKAIGLGSLARGWLGDFDWALPAVMFMGFPWTGGVTMLIYFAGLLAIPESLIDAAAMDGATGIRRFLAIDIPLIMGQIKLMVILAAIGTIQGFQSILLLTDGGPGHSTLVPALFMYQRAFGVGADLGYGCAVGVSLFLVILLLTWINMKYIRSSTELAGA